MNTKDYLEKYQPVIFKTMTNALTGHHLSHAYLISGESGTPLLSIAMLFAKSLVCDHPTPFACDNCITCLRMDDGNFQDLSIINGKDKTIKKDDIQKIIADFAKTSSESKGKMIYIINLVENMTVEAVNSLLKFLEEPGKEIYAFLTTENENRVLPTIISRTQVLHIKLISRSEIISDALSLGVAKVDAEILSYFYNDANEILENVQNDTYLNAKECIDKLLPAFIEGNGKSVFITQTYIDSVIKTKEAARLFLDYLGEIFRDLINIKNGNQVILASYDIILHDLVRKLNHLEDSLFEIMSLRNKIDLNLNLPLVFDHLAYYISKGANKND